MSLTRRSLLGWLSALPVLGVRRPSANPPPEVLPDQATPPGIPVVEFDADGSIKNANEIFGDMPFEVTKATDDRLPFLSRAAIVYVPEAVAASSWHGIGRLIHSRGPASYPGGRNFESLLLHSTAQSIRRRYRRPYHTLQAPPDSEYFALTVSKKPYTP